MIISYKGTDDICFIQLHGLVVPDTQLIIFERVEWKHQGLDHGMAMLTHSSIHGQDIQILQVIMLSILKVGLRYSGSYHVV